MNPVDFEKFDLLSDEEKIKVYAEWSDDDWYNYFVSKGTITLNEFCEKLKEVAYKAMEKKFGPDWNRTETDTDKKQERQF